MSKKKFNEAEFKEFCKEAIPHIEALQKLLEKRDMENLGSLNFSADGYVTFSVYDTGWELGRLRKGEFTMRHEIGLEEKPGGGGYVPGISLGYISQNRTAYRGAGTDGADRVQNGTVQGKTPGVPDVGTD